MGVISKYQNAPNIAIHLEYYKCTLLQQSRKKTHRFEVMHVIFVTLTHIIGQDVNGLVKHTQVPNVIRVAMSAHTVMDLFWRQPIFLQALKTEK